MSEVLNTIRIPEYVKYYQTVFSTQASGFSINNAFYEQGRTAGYEQGRTAGYEQGHAAGYEQGKEESIGLEIIFIGNLDSEGTFDIKPFYSDYAKLATPNFALSDIGATKDGSQGENNSSNASISMSYNAATGILTVSKNIGGDGAGIPISIGGKVYLYAPKQ